MTRGVRFARLARAIGVAMAWYASLVARTSRLRGDVTRDQVVVAFWHEYNLAGIVVALMRRRDLVHASFSTRGFRGIVVTTMLERLAVRVVPLPTEGADPAEALSLTVRMARSASSGYSPVVAPDGPFGPYRVAKPGALIVARAAGLPVIAWGIDARPALRLRARWDRHVVPLPFGRLRVVQGEPIRVAPRQALGPVLPRLQATLDELGRRVERRPSSRR